jgi:hypothetical protein
MSGIKGTRDLIESRLLAQANNLKSIERVCSLIRQLNNQTLRKQVLWDTYYCNKQSNGKTANVDQQALVFRYSRLVHQVHDSCWMFFP